MLRFFLKRLATIIPTVILASMIIFALQQLLPGDDHIVRRMDADNWIHLSRPIWWGNHSVSAGM